VRREPNQNGYVDSFHGRLRDECLNREQFWTLTEARVVIEDYRRVPSKATSPSHQTWTYNTFRPHSKLGYLSPERFAARKNAPSPSPVGLRPPYAGDGQPNNNPLETKTTPKDELSTGSKSGVPSRLLLPFSHPSVLRNFRIFLVLPHLPRLHPLETARITFFSVSPALFILHGRPFTPRLPMTHSAPSPAPSTHEAFHVGTLTYTKGPSSRSSSGCSGVTFASC